MFLHLKVHLNIKKAKKSIGSDGGEKLFACSECNSKFWHEQGLKRHCKIHSGEKPFGCSECDKKFLRKYCLDRHELLVHTNEAILMCRV